VAIEHARRRQPQHVQSRFSIRQRGEQGPGAAAPSP
jgi:hypothetical protein